MTFADMMAAETILINAVDDIVKQLRAAENGEVEGFSIDVNTAKTNAGQIISDLQQKFNTFKQEAKKLI